MAIQVRSAVADAGKYRTVFSPNYNSSKEPGTLWGNCFSLAIYKTVEHHQSPCNVSHLPLRCDPLQESSGRAHRNTCTFRRTHLIQTVSVLLSLYISFLQSPCDLKRNILSRAQFYIFGMRGRMSIACFAQFWLERLSPFSSLIFGERCQFLHALAPFRDWRSTTSFGSWDLCKP